MFVYELMVMINEDMVYILARSMAGLSHFIKVSLMYSRSTMNGKCPGSSREMDLKLSVNFRTDQVRQVDLLFHAALDLIDVYHC